MTVLWFILKTFLPHYMLPACCIFCFQAEILRDRGNMWSSCRTAKKNKLDEIRSFVLIRSLNWSFLHLNQNWKFLVSFLNLLIELWSFKIILGKTLDFHNQNIQSHSWLVLQATKSWTDVMLNMLPDGAFVIRHLTDDLERSMITNITISLFMLDLDYWLCWKWCFYQSSLKYQWVVI